jgi:hypothetical protein
MTLHVGKYQFPLTIYLLVRFKDDEAITARIRRNQRRTP